MCRCHRRLAAVPRRPLDVSVAAGAANTAVGAAVSSRQAVQAVAVAVEAVMGGILW